jgi:hypothetical protein
MNCDPRRTAHGASSWHFDQRPFPIAPGPPDFSEDPSQADGMIAIVIFAVIAGADGWVGIADYGRAKKD